jgi:hypothetical protein
VLVLTTDVSNDLIKNEKSSGKGEDRLGSFPSGKSILDFNVNVFDKGKGTILLLQGCGEYNKGNKDSGKGSFRVSSFNGINLIATVVDERTSRLSKTVYIPVSSAELPDPSGLTITIRRIRSGIVGKERFI